MTSQNRVSQKFWDPEVPSKGMLSTAKLPPLNVVLLGADLSTQEALEANSILVGLCVSGSGFTWPLSQV